ncbi:MAG: amidohydrolase [Bacteroidia bacterium]|nr:amidohydrolase [Bacteroidia bacterium]
MSLNASQWREKIQSAAGNIFPSIQKVRRHLHQHPELSFNEFKTSEYLQNLLKDAGIPFVAGLVKTGIRAEIKGASDGRQVALRGDMDALPIQETNKTAYKSINDGVMHACGHDVHSACLLGAGMILHSLAEHLPGTVVLVFQPGEEQHPGGARLMLEDGVFQDRHPSSIFAQHVFPTLPAGMVGFREGRYMASSDEIFIKVRGKGGHAAMPHQLVDPVHTAAQMLVAMQAVSSRFAPPLVPTVLSFGKVIANGATNVIPDEVLLEGTFRTMDEQWRNKAHEQILRIATETAHAYGAKADVEISRGYPVLYNHEALTRRSRHAAEEYLGKEQVVNLDMRMTAEDFAWFAQEMPACFYRLGTAGQNGAYTSGVHTSTFDIDEQALITGMGMMAWLAVNELLQP